MSMKKIIIILLFSLPLFAMEHIESIKLKLQKELVLPNSDHAELLSDQNTKSLLLKMNNPETKIEYTVGLPLEKLLNITINKLVPTGLALTPAPQQELIITSFGTEKIQNDLCIILRCPLDKLPTLNNPSLEGSQFFHSKSSDGTLEEIKLKLLQNKVLKTILKERSNQDPGWLHKFYFLVTSEGPRGIVFPKTKKIYQENKDSL